MNSTEVQNPRRKLHDKIIIGLFGFVPAYAKSAHVFQKLSYLLCRLCLQLITLPQTERLFYVSLCSRASRDLDSELNQF